MSDYSVISGVSAGLAGLLQEHLSSLFSTTVQVDLRSPKAIGVPTNPMTVSLWLYRVVRDEFTLNDPPVRTVSDQKPRPRLPVDLHYLATPMHKDAGTAQSLLGAVLQTFNDHSLLHAADLGTPSPIGDRELKIALETLTLEELSQVWFALSEPYLLSVSYLAQVVMIESGHEPVQGAAVLERRMQYEQVLSVTP